MSKPTQVLSTRKLTADQQSLLDTAIDFHQYDAISIDLLPPNQGIPSGFTAIFTSQNAVKACDQILKEGGVEVCCVGSKTKALLTAYPVNILVAGDNAASLAEILVGNFPEHRFIHYCGDRRLGDLSRILKAHNIEFREEVVYRTHLKNWSLGQDFDIVLFYSPSGVESFYSSLEGSNKMLEKADDFNPQLICIGPTTAEAAQEYTERIIIALEPTIESVLEALNELIIS